MADQREMPSRREALMLMFGASAVVLRGSTQLPKVDYRLPPLLGAPDVNHSRESMLQTETNTLMHTVDRIIDAKDMDWDSRVGEIATLVEQFSQEKLPGYLESISIDVIFGFQDVHRRMSSKSEEKRIVYDHWEENADSKRIRDINATQIATLLRDGREYYQHSDRLPTARIEIVLDFPQVQGDIPYEALRDRGIPEFSFANSQWCFPREIYTFDVIPVDGNEDRVIFNAEQYVSIGHPSGRSGVMDLRINRKGNVPGIDHGVFPLIPKDKPGIITMYPGSDFPQQDVFENAQEVFDMVSALQPQFGKRF